MVIGLSGVHLGLQSYFVTKNMISDGIGLPEVLYQLITKITICKERWLTKLWKKKWKICIETEKVVCVSMVTETEDVIGWYNYNFGCNWLIELSHNKLSDNNLASKLIDKVSFWKQSQSRNL